jgi:hypothetical protein
MRSVARIPRGAAARSTAAPDEHQVARITGILGRRSRRHGFTDRPKSRRRRPSGAFAWREAKCPRLDKPGELANAFDGRRRGLAYRANEAADVDGLSRSTLCALIPVACDQPRVGRPQVDRAGGARNWSKLC